MQIEISTQQLNSDISTMNQQLEALQSARDNVFSCMEQLSTMWEGPAHYQFQRQVMVDSNRLTNLMKEIQNLIDCMQYARQEYDKCHDTVWDKISSLRLSSDT
ncbi:MAG: hypothetical protein IJO28_05460 [Oscillospiraceae bacterium]|nr:hypothetical protein [Oscillospiraceae bacterium]